MGSSGSIGRHASGQLRTRFMFVSIALATLLLPSGCDRIGEQDLASRDFEKGTAPLRTGAADGAGSFDSSSGLDDTATVPSLPKDQTEPKPELKPPPVKLGIGDANPGLHLAKWVKGDPVDETLTGDKVHVVEFWATWCGPCRVGMPHISELQHEYADEVAFIGVTSETESKVASFLKAASPDGRPWEDVIQYRLAIDDGGWTNSAYMRAAGQNGIPCAFVVGRDGVVEWIGHPGRIDEPLKQIVEGSWDREAAIEEFKQQERLKEISVKIAQFARSGDWNGALEMLEQVEAETGKSTGLLKYRLKLLESAGRDEEASAVRAELVEDAWNDAQALNEIAWTTATSGKSADLELALKAATRASEIRDDKDAMILDTLARCHYELGDLDEAIKWQRLAVEHNQGLREIDAALQRYLNEQAAAEKTETEAAATDENVSDDASTSATDKSDDEASSE